MSDKAMKDKKAISTEESGGIKIIDCRFHCGGRGVRIDSHPNRALQEWAMRKIGKL